MKKSFKYNHIELNANDDSFLNTKINFTPEVFEYDESKIPYEVMEVICDIFHKWRMDYVSRAGVRNEKIKNEEPRLKAIRKQIEDLRKTERKAQVILKWLGIRRKDGIPEPKGTKYANRSIKSGLANGINEDVDFIKEDNDEQSV